jgi:hypothetical protein
VSARQLKPIEKLMLKLTTKSQIEFSQARYLLIIVQLPIVITSASLAANLLLVAVKVFQAVKFVQRCILNSDVYLLKLLFDKNVE